MLLEKVKLWEFSVFELPWIISINKCLNDAYEFLLNIFLKQYVHFSAFIMHTIWNIKFSFCGNLSLNSHCSIEGNVIIRC